MLIILVTLVAPWRVSIGDFWSVTGFGNSAFICRPVDLGDPDFGSSASIRVPLLGVGLSTTEAPLPSRNDEVYMGSGFIMRIGLIVSVDDSIDEGSGSLSLCTVAPDGNSSRDHIARVSAVRQGRQGPKGRELGASGMSTRGRIQLE